MFFIDTEQCSLFVNISIEMSRFKDKYIEQMTINDHRFILLRQQKGKHKYYSK